MTDLIKLSVAVESLAGEIEKAGHTSNSKHLWRFAGMVELLLVQYGLCVPGEKYEYKTSGNPKWLGFIDMTMRETYPVMILRLAQSKLTFVKNTV